MIHILLAAYNEEEALGLVLEGIARTIADGGYRIWIVDDGSTDGTARVADEWDGKIPLAVITHVRNMGLGAALQTGLSRLKDVLKTDDVLVTLDADNTHPPQLIPRLTQPLEENKADIAIASRFAPGGESVGVPAFRRLTSSGVKWLYRTCLPIPGVRDFTCGFRAYRGDLMRKAFDRWDKIVTEDGFAATVEWLARLAPFSPRVVEVPLVLRYDRKPGKSKMPVWNTIRRTLVLLPKLRRLR
jgi:dolichol-phosphate mannosyltransferase